MRYFPPLNMVGNEALSFNWILSENIGCTVSCATLWLHTYSHSLPGAALAPAAPWLSRTPLERSKGISIGSCTALWIHAVWLATPWLCADFLTALWIPTGSRVTRWLCAEPGTSEESSDEPGSSTELSVQLIQHAAREQGRIQHKHSMWCWGRRG